MSFTTLPTELKLTLLSQTHCPKGVTSELDQLTSYIQRKKLAHYISAHPIQLSLFSPNAKESHRKLFYETQIASTSPHTSFISLGPLHHKESIIQITNSKDTYKNESALDLIMTEEQESAKLYVSLLDTATNSKIVEKSTYITEGSNYIYHEGLKIEIEMKRGEIEPPKQGTYDWDDTYNYSLQVKDIHLGNDQLLALFEKDEEDCMIVRY